MFKETPEFKIFKQHHPSALFLVISSLIAAGIDVKLPYFRALLSFYGLKSDFKNTELYTNTWLDECPNFATVFAEKHPNHFAALKNSLINA